MKPEPAVFTKDKPCTKAELWRCFRADPHNKRGLEVFRLTSPGGFWSVQVDEAHAIIGKNAPRYMESKGYLVVDRTPRSEFYRLTPAGEDWLINGIKAYAKNHPVEAAKLPYLPLSASPGRVIRRRR